MEGFGSAMLTDEIAPERRVTTVLERDQIRAALEQEDGARLVARLARGATDAPAEETAIAIDWSRSQLEQLLERVDGDRVVLAFDAEQLADAFADVEAHGLRRRAAIVTVAALGAVGAGAGIAAAVPVSGGGAGSSATSAPEMWINTGRVDIPLPGIASPNVDRPVGADLLAGYSCEPGQLVVGAARFVPRG